MTHSFLAAEVKAGGGEADFCFLPGKADRELMDREGIPFLTGAFSHRDWRDFDLVMITNAYTLEMLNLVPLLEQSGVALYSRSRPSDAPLFLLGGANASAVQGLLKPLETGGWDAVPDGIFFGEGEGAVAQMVKTWQTLDPGLTRGEKLMHLSTAVPGLWTPWTERPVVKARCQARGKDLLTDYPVLNSEEALTARLQISFGCPFFCGFCFEGYDRKPYREVPAREILQAAQELKKNTGARNIDLYSFNFNTHRDIAFLLGELNKQFLNVSFLSQRLDVLEAVPGLLDLELAADKRSFTLGVEGISRRQRRFYQKGLPEESLSRILHRMVRSPIREIKLFYILSGHENREDFQEFHHFLEDLKNLRQQFNPGVKLLFSFGLLIRMPGTPLAYDRLMMDPGAWDPIIQGTKETVEGAGFDFRLAFDTAEYDFSQVLALGGYEVHDLILRSARQQVWFDRSLPPTAGKVLGRWLEDTRWREKNSGEKPSGWPWPLEFLQGVPRDFLYRRYQEAKKYLEEAAPAGTETCLAGNCLGCRSCEGSEKKFLLDHQVNPPGQNQIRDLGNLIKTRGKLGRQVVVVEIPPQWAGAGRAWTEAAFRRRLQMEFPQAALESFDLKELLWLDDKNSLGGCLVTGKTLLEIKGSGDLLSQISRNFRGWPSQDGAFREVRWDIRLPKEGFPEAPVRFSRWLHDRHLPHTLFKQSSSWSWQIAEKGLSKKDILAASAESDGQEILMKISTGPKADIRGYLACFPGVRPEFKAVLHITDIF